MDGPLQDGRFLLLDTLGRGGMASVYRAFDRVDERLVALKVEGNGGLAGPGHPLSTEFAAWIRVRHPNIVQIYDLAVARAGPLAADTPYLVLEHVEGGPADAVLVPGRTNGRLLERFAVQALQGLEHVHRAGLIHRDVKPANLLTRVSRGGAVRVKLTDFGLAVRGGRAGSPGRFSGSLPYVSPEALLGEPLDGRTDLFGLGLVLYRLATGRMPFEESALESIIRWRFENEGADPRRHRNGVPDRLARFIRRMTATDREQRPGSALEALRLLGAEPPPRRRVTWRGTHDPPGLAETRLALDSIRLGARRCHALPDAAGPLEQMLREVRVWARTRGIRFHTLVPGPPRGKSGLLRLVLCLLSERQDLASQRVVRFGLRRWLPLSLLGGQPVPDPRWAQSSRSRVSPGGEGARAVARFILACARERPLVLRVERIRRLDPLSRGVVRELRRATSPPRPPRDGTGGFLLLTRQDFHSAR